MAPCGRALSLAAAALLPLLAAASGLATELFTTNAACRQRHCINPIFPALLDLGKLSQVSWVCSSQVSVKPYLDFCKEPVNYDPALPSPSNAAGSPITKLVKNQEDAAMTAYFYHLSGMGLEPWDHQDPSKTKDECVKTVWRMACFTYFPRSQAGCSEGGATLYLKPCMSSCGNYKKQCGVECCDGSDMCVFEHTSTPPGTNVSLTQSGYVNQLGPSAFCTGSAGRRGPHIALLGGLLFLQAMVSGFGSVSLPRVAGGKVALVAAAALLAATLQGFDYSIPTHEVGLWRKAKNYLVSFEYIPEGQPSATAVLNSCNPKNLAEVTEQCGGNGFCTQWNYKPGKPKDLLKAKPVMFCKCDPDYTDPECRTRRKSQTVAFLYSLFLGFLGADHFYMGFILSGGLKLVTLGGLGVWWIRDIIYVGSSPVYAFNYKLAADLPFWIYIFAVFAFLSFIGFAVALFSAAHHRAERRSNAILKIAGEQASWTADSFVIKENYGSAPTKRVSF